MRKAIVILAMAAAVSARAEMKFSAADVPWVHLRKGAKIVINGETLASQQRARIAGTIDEAAREHGVDARLLTAIARRESAFNENAVSRAGAVGIMQLMPATAHVLGVNVYDTRENIFGAARYLRKLLDTYHGDLDLTLAAYNAGPGAVLKYGGVPPYRETQAYVKTVRAMYERAAR
jgi:soluble lytic murein transglycosylase-like protein